MLLMCGNPLLSLNAVQTHEQGLAYLRLITMPCVPTFNLVMRNETDGDGKRIVGGMRRIQTDTANALFKLAT